jgi:mono/diheme cytochrome c family protein
MKFTWLVAAGFSVATVGFAQQDQNALVQSEKDGVVKTELYTVVDGYKVDRATMMGFRTWRAVACDRCHGANQQGLVGPSLIDSLKVLSKDDFKKAIIEGRLQKGMPGWQNSKTVMDNLDNLYAYLKGRSDGAIKRAKVEELKE